MGTNASWLAVNISPSRLAALEAAVAASYEARKCLVAATAHEPELEPSAEPPKRGKLGLALLPVDKGWIALVDSTGYLADATLASDLAERLGVTVFCEVVAEVADYHGIFRYGPAMAPEKAPPMPSGYADVDDHPKKTRYLLVDRLRAGAYRTAKGPSCKARCKACGYTLGWTPGYDVPYAPEPGRIAAFAGTKKGAPQTGKLLVATRCNQCGAPLGWAVARLDRGLIVGADPLAKHPSDRAAFDAYLEDQRELVEAALPSKATLEVRARAKSFPAAYAAAPRTALEEALARVRPTLRQTRLPLLAWSFASTREELVQVVKKSTSDFAWKDIDLPGKVRLQLVAWLGPKPKAPVLEAFLEQVGALLGETSFARQGRHPKTGEWMTCVGFPLPDGSWAGLRLFDQHR
ncbi:MAG: hypothetical protein JNL21_01800 [Myxococcales bacterium]|nr:hypothetical protein [Myxococcales bacterium]